MKGVCASAIGVNHYNYHLEAGIINGTAGMISDHKIPITENKKK